ncbi:hypothetical protein M885DRAFT_614604 [Pelagophyceae sp. CCMP2097]|nr:hypothetical protein M885DRAFT_614604 [Pelagophyceae sp. CCMP2097]
MPPKQGRRRPAPCRFAAAPAPALAPISSLAPPAAAPLAQTLRSSTAALRRHKPGPLSPEAAAAATDLYEAAAAALSRHVAGAAAARASKRHRRGCGGLDLKPRMRLRLGAGAGLLQGLPPQCAARALGYLEARDFGTIASLSCFRDDDIGSFTLAEGVRGACAAMADLGWAPLRCGGGGGFPRPALEPLRTACDVARALRGGGAFDASALRANAPPLEGLHEFWCDLFANVDDIFQPHRAYLVTFLTALFATLERSALKSSHGPEAILAFVEGLQQPAPPASPPPPAQAVTVSPTPGNDSPQTPQEDASQHDSVLVALLEAGWPERLRRVARLDLARPSEEQGSGGWAGARRQCARAAVSFCVRVRRSRWPAVLAQRARADCAARCAVAWLLGDVRRQRRGALQALADEVARLDAAVVLTDDVGAALARALRRRPETLSAMAHLATTRTYERTGAHESKPHIAARVLLRATLAAADCLKVADVSAHALAAIGDLERAAATTFKCAATLRAVGTRISRAARGGGERPAPHLGDATEDDDDDDDEGGGLVVVGKTPKSSSVLQLRGARRKLAYGGDSDDDSDLGD